MNGLKNFGWAFLGFLIACATILAIVGIGCAVNGLTFSEQIVEWFSNNSSAIENVVEDVIEPTAKFLF